MNPNQERFPSLIVGSYAWMITIFFGLILLDIVYSNLLKDVLITSAISTVFSTVSDGLLLFGVFVILTAFKAIVFSWKSVHARNLFIASLLVVSFEFVIPVLFIPFVEYVDALNIGPWLRIIPSGLASILAFIGVYHHYRKSQNFS